MVIKREIAEWKVWKRDIEGKLVETMGEMAENGIWIVEIEKKVGEIGCEKWRNKKESRKAGEEKKKIREIGREKRS